VRVYLVPQVAKVMRKARLPEAALCRIAAEVLTGTLSAGEADLGDGLFKKRMARPGGGKSGGYRVIVAYRAPTTSRVLFAFMFAKNVVEALAPGGRAALAKVASAFIAANDAQVAALLMSGGVKQVECHGDEQS